MTSEAERREELREVQIRWRRGTSRSKDQDMDPCGKEDPGKKHTEPLTIRSRSLEYAGHVCAMGRGGFILKTHMMPPPASDSQLYPPLGCVRVPLMSLVLILLGGLYVEKKCINIKHFICIN